MSIKEILITMLSVGGVFLLFGALMVGFLWLLPKVLGKVFG